VPVLLGLTLRRGWPSAFFIPSLAGMLWILPWLKPYWEPWRHTRLTEQERASYAPAGGPLRRQHAGVAAAGGGWVPAAPGAASTLARISGLTGFGGGPVTPACRVRASSRAAGIVRILIGMFVGGGNLPVIAMGAWKGSAAAPRCSTGST